MGKNNSRYEPVELLTSVARTSSDTGDSVFALEGFDGCEAMMFVLDLTNAHNTAGDKLDVYVQIKVDNASTPNWVDIVRFTQILGNGADALTYVAKVLAGTAETEFESAAALSAASYRNLLAQEMRVRWVVTDGSGAATFTFSVSAVPM